ncbi:MAG: 50S ribosomal protein L18e [Candidatus Heimdallarchaeota archaeon]
MKISNMTDPNRLALVRYLKKLSQEKSGAIWAMLASELSKTNKRRIAVNLSRLNRVTSAGDVILVPGKVLAGGSLGHKLEIAAESFSSAAREKIKVNGGQCLSIMELVKKNPTGSGVRLVK